MINQADEEGERDTETQEHTIKKCYCRYLAKNSKWQQ